MLTGLTGTTGNLNCEGLDDGSLKFQLPAVNHFVAETSEVFPVSSIHSLSSKVVNQLLSDAIVFPFTKIAGTNSWQKTFMLTLCFPAGIVNFAGVPSSNCP